MWLEIPKSFKVPSSYISEIEAFKILAEFLREEKRRVCQSDDSTHCVAVNRNWNWK